MGRFEDLQVWQRAVALSISIYQQTQSLRDFGFRNQITKAGLSIPSNIAEGLERTSSADKVRFLDYARASCGEVRTQVVVGSGPGFIAEELANEWIAETKEISAMLQGLIRAIQKRSVKEQAAEYSLN